MPNKYGYGANKAANSNTNKNKSKYARDPEEKKSKYLRNGVPNKSKYLRDKHTPVEHHYNLTRNIREEEEIAEEVLDGNEISDNAEFVETPETAEAVEAVQDEHEKAVDEVENETRRTALFASSVGSSKTRTDETEDALRDESKKRETLDISEGTSSSENENGEASAVTKEEKEAFSKKGNDSSVFSHSGLSKDTAVAHIADEEEARKKLIVSTVITMVILTAVACALQFAAISPWFFPSMLTIEFSVFPELIASIAYGPVFGIFIVLIKNIFHILISNKGFVSELSNFVLDGTFVFIAGLFYSRKMFSVDPRTLKRTRNRNKRDKIFYGGLLASAVTTVISYFLTRFVSYPLLLKQYADKGLNTYYIITNYQSAIDRINNYVPEKISLTISEIETLNQAILFFNVPVTFVKFLFVTIVSAIVYVIISPYLHFKKKSK